MQIPEKMLIGYNYESSSEIFILSSNFLKLKWPWGNAPFFPIVATVLMLI